MKDRTKNILIGIVIGIAIGMVMLYLLMAFRIVQPFRFFGGFRQFNMTSPPRYPRG
ncbi:MAG: hypothetical protein QXQ40_01270 [Candidatus Aenigmatarchaeota archaeon]